MQRKIRVLVGKPGLDGHDRGAKVVAAALRDAGMEVIYTGLHQTPDQVVEAAVQEDVDVVALSILSGAHMTLFPDVLELMKQRGIGDRLLTGGGIIPAEDMDTLRKSGVGRLFGPGASTQDIVHYIREWFVSQHGADSLAPLPPVVKRASPAYSPVTAAPAAARPASRTRSAGPAKPKRSKAKPARPKPSKGPKRARATPSSRPASKPKRAKAVRRAAPRRSRRAPARRSKRSR